MNDCLNFCIGGMAGDFIHNLYSCKNICEQKGVKANLYLGGGDPFKFGRERAFNDLKELVLMQDYVNSFQILSNTFKEPFIDLNSWREGVFKTRHSTGKYDKCWSRVLSETYGFEIPDNYQSVFVNKKNKDTYCSVVIHRSLNRNNSDFKVWERLFSSEWGTIYFVTSNEEEYNKFEFRYHCKLYLVETFLEMAEAINSSILFIGNQSAPFALANALDVTRICELDYDAAPFYIFEEKYSKNIEWELNENIKFYH